MSERRPRSRLTSGEWRSICAVLDRVHDAPAAMRHAALAEACRDEGVAVEDVRPFLEAEAKSDSLPELVPAELMAEAFADYGQEPPRLEPGTRLGPYAIAACIGTGGMGEVYRAQDTRLDRTVAVKVLRPHLLGRPDARERFDREARAISSLNHSHVCTLHDVGHQDGIDFLVMEYVDGETLAALLRKGPLPPEQALRFGSQIADALDRAHRQGIVHRDLKPANVMITRAGVKLLDFGLALVEASAAPDVRALAGTPQYMAPEQMQGHQADARTDIYACGAVLYEMITGRREPPPEGPLVPGGPPSLDWALSRCLANDPDDRWQSAADLAHHLDWVATGPEVLPAHIESRRNTPAWIVAAIVIAAGGWWWTGRPANSTALSTAVFAIEPPAGAAFTLTPALSPDGRRLAFTTTDDGRRALWVRSLDALTAQRIDDTEGAGLPFWSPDGRFVAFFAARQLKKVDLASGGVHVICDAPGGGGGGTWNEDDVIVFSPASGVTTGLQRVSAAGGDPVPITAPEDGLRIHAWPQFLPGGKRFIYMRAGSSAPGIYAGTLDSDEAHVLVMPQNGAPTKAIVASGVLFFLDRATLVAQRFDADRLKVEGEPVRIAEGIFVGSPGLGAFDAAAGVITYRQPALLPRVQLTWVDRAGQIIGSLGSPGRYATVALSPDGRVVLANGWDDGGRAATGTVSRIDATTGAATPAFTRASVPIWSPDGTRVIFTRFQPGGSPTPVVALLDGNEPERPLAAFDAQAYAADWSRDGRDVVGVSLHADSGADIWRAAADGGEAVRYLVREPFHQYQPRLSPDGRWLAYASTDAEGGAEVYVRAFPDGSHLRRVSTRGGRSPRWRGDGRELYYVEPGGRVMAVPVAGGDAFTPGAPKLLFQHEGLDISPQAAFAGFAYDVTSDGARFVLAVPLDETQTPPPAIVMLDWRFPLPR